MQYIMKETPYTKSVTNTSTSLLPAVVNRKYAEIANPTAVGMFLGMGKTAVIGEGAYIPPQSVYIIDDRNLWNQAVNIIASTAGPHVVSATDWQ